MNITYRPMTSAEAWKFIEGRHRAFHSHLKHFGYKYDMFIPDHPAIREMYEQENLAPDQLQKYRDIFLNEIYNIEDLKRLDFALAEEALPALWNVVDVLTPKAKKWGVRFPGSVEIRTTYGFGGSYSVADAAIIFRMFRGARYNPKNAASLLQHEFIHLLIERPIVQKYNVPQDLKERIVDIIGFEYFGRPVQPLFENSFADKYITKETIETDLPTAVEQMMSAACCSDDINGRIA